MVSRLLGQLLHSFAVASQSCSVGARPNPRNAELGERPVDEEWTHHAWILTIGPRFETVTSAQKQFLSAFPSVFG